MPSLPERYEVQDESASLFAADLIARALPCDVAARLFGMLRGNGKGNRNGIQGPGVRFVHHVPAPLRKMGCMWLDQGYEDRRCGRPVAWTMGADLSLARFYCESHGREIRRRRRRTNAASQRRRAAQKKDPAILPDP